MSMDLTVFAGQIEVGNFIGGFMHGQSAGPGMMAPEAAAGSAIKLLRQARAWASIVDHGREDAGFQAAGEGCVVFGIGQTGLDQFLDNLCTVGLGETGSVPD